MGLTPVVSLDIAKMYLRVDSADEDELIGLLLLTAERMVMDVSRLSVEEWQEIQTVDVEDDDTVIIGRTNTYSHDEAVQIRELLKVAILYAVGYLYEHREEADHHSLMLTLRNLLFAVREGVV